MKIDGTHEIVKLPSTLSQCKTWFEENSCSSNEVEICDIHVTDKCGGKYIEYTCAIYDCATGVTGRNLFFSYESNLKSERTSVVTEAGVTFIGLKKGAIAHYGDILIFKTRAKKRSFDDMGDVVQDSGITFEEASMTLNTFREDLKEAFLPEWKESEFFFPVMWGSYDSSRNFVLGPDHYTLYSEYGNIVEVDLLTRKRKNRTFSMNMFQPGRHQTIVDNMSKNSMGFCMSCHEIARVTCSKCSTFYNCGKNECHLEAWEAHKGSCVKKSDAGSGKKKGKKGKK